MLALDHREGFRKIINPENPDSVDTQAAINIKKEILDSLKDKFSAFLIDDEYGLPALASLSRCLDKPYLLAIENTGYKEEDRERITVVEKSALELKNLGASGVKLLLYFNPEAKSSQKQIETAKKVLEDAHNNNLPLFLEIVTYGTESEDRVVKSLQAFLNNDVIADIFKLEFPGNEELCKKVTEMLGATPWIILTRGAEYDLFCKQLEISTKNGCKGFLAGRSLWQDLLTIKDVTEKQKFLKETLPARFDELTKIATLS